LAKRQTTTRDGAVFNESAVLPSPAAQASLAKWHSMIEEHDFSDLPSIVAADAVFRSPVGLKPYPGRDLVCLLLRTRGGRFRGFQVSP